MILGISIDENYVYVNVEGESDVKEIPFALGRNLTTNSWFIGDAAKNENIDSTDIVIDKLYYLIENDRNARIGDVKYEAKDLVQIFINNLLQGYGDVEYVTIVVRSSNVKILSKLKGALLKYVKDESKIKVTTYSEAFAAYIRSKSKEYYDNPIALINFTEKALTFYELIRYKAEDDLEYWKINTKEHLSLPLDLLSGDTGKKVCDNLLYDFAKNCIKEEVYNNIILSGVGFEDSSSYREFMTYVCGITVVDTSINFFAKSAAILSRDFLDDRFDKNVVMMTDARTTVSLSVFANVDMQDTKIEIIKPGTEWFSIYNNSFNVIVDNESEIRFECLKVIEGVIKELTMRVPDMNNLRKDKTNQFSVKLTFLQQNLLQITVSDIGFGEFYEPTFGSVSDDKEL